MMAWIEQMMRAGGWVMYPLAAMSLVSLTLIFERTWFWLGTDRPRRLARFQAVTRALEHADTDKTTRVVRSDKSVYGVFVRSLGKTLPRTTDRARAEVLARDQIELARPRIERFSVTLSTIITAAPMLGILGTVTGIITSFRVLSGGQITDPSEVAGGIAQALLTTAFGLVIALVTLFPYMIYRAHADRCFARLELLAEALIATHGPGDGGGSDESA